MLGLFGLIFSCQQKETENELGFSLIQVNDSLSLLQIKTDSTLDQWELPYPVYQFQIGDIDADGSEDALVGVIKPTRFDSISRKRLFIFKNYQNLVRPLWLGSQLGRPLVDFTHRITETGPSVWAIENDNKNSYLVAEYKWRKFGLHFTKYHARALDLQSAYALLNP